MDIIYKKYFKSGKLMQTAKLVKLETGRYSFETSLFGTEPYFPNVNMPIFNSEEEAKSWIENSYEWR